jgi:hypothetical protein
MNETTEDLAADTGRPRFSELAANALRYWEPRRVLYNAALFLVVLLHFWSAWPGSRAFLVFDVLFLFFILAVLANIAYCAAYAVDLFVQFSALRASWPRWRWTVLATGTAFAAVLTHFFVMAMLQGQAPNAG